MNADPATQHGISAIAMVAAPVSFWVHAPEIVTVIAGTLGIVWYSIIITEKIVSFVTKKKIEDVEAPDPPEIHKHH